MRINRVYRNGTALAIIAALFPLFSGCEEETLKLAGSYPGPNRSFLIKVSVDAEIAKDFAHKRVTVQGLDGGGIGNASRVRAADGIRYRITLPSSYLDQDVLYVVEFYRENSGFDKVATVKALPVMLELLKSRYCTIEGETTPPSSSSEEVTLTVGKDAELKLGYDPGGLSLADIPQAPIVYFLKFDATALSSYKFEFIGGAATAQGGEFVTPADSTDDQIGSEGVLGVTGKDFDWAMIMTPGKYDLSEGPLPFTVWFFMKLPKDSVYCPCLTSCNCGAICPYKVMAANGKTFTFAKKDISPPFNVENGDTLANFSLTESDLIKCDVLASQLE
jgi:hypothetical protein